tara:strand:+ start:29301 stop:31544 length:2244 start_codon:yes stop_codon:yes gene_type:complete
MIKELEIGKLNDVYEKYGDLGFKVETPYGYYNISWCGITEENADVYRCELEDGKYVEGADYHRLKKEDGGFVVLKELEVGETIQIIGGETSKVKSVELQDFKDTLYDIQVDEVHQYYTNGIVSHNTVLLIDTMKFLLFGVTSKYKKNEQLFHKYRDKNTLTVRGLLKIEGDDEIIIERILTRRPKKGGDWTVVNSLKYYRILPDGEEELLNEEDATVTTKKIRTVVGTVEDFDVVTLATGKNLDNIIDMPVGQSGKIFTKLIGLEIMELKETLAREMYTKYAKTMKSNIYNNVELSDEIAQDELKLELTAELLSNANTKLSEVTAELVILDAKKTELLNSKEKVDERLVLTNPITLQANIDEITRGGKKIKTDLDELTESLVSVGEVDFDEYKEKRTNDSLNEVKTTIAIKKAEIERLRTEIGMLKKAGICPSCDRPLDDVNHEDHIGELTQKGVTLSKEVTVLAEEEKSLFDQVNAFKGVKEELDRKQRLELEIGRIKLKLEAHRNKLREALNTQKEYEENIKFIEFNKGVEAKLDLINSDTQAKNYQKDETIKKIQMINNEISNLTANVKRINELLVIMSTEAKVERLFKVYINMVGKKGVSKIVLRSVLPIINSELERLLEGVCDFDIEVKIDDKNEVHLLIIKNDVEGLLTGVSGFEKTVAGVALRTVLGVVSTLPMPNFITFDEVLDKVAPENIPQMRPLFDKVKDMYDKVFVITHDDLAKDWSEQIITISKVKDISKIDLN